MRSVRFDVSCVAFVRSMFRRIGGLFAVCLCAWMVSGAGVEARAAQVQFLKEERAMELKLTCESFTNGAPIPAVYSYVGRNVSPALKWTEPPAGTKSFALIVHDADAPGGIWVHWVLYDIPADRRSLSQGLPKLDRVEGGCIQGVNDYRKTGYDGAGPPPGKTHRYFFRLYALDVPSLGLVSGAGRARVLAAMSGHILGKAELMGTFRR